MLIQDQRPLIYGLHAVVAIGPFNIIRYTKQQLSPFNVTDQWDVPYFTKSQVTQLFMEFQTSCDVVLEPEVVDRVYEITLGHPGMVCWCGKAIQDNLVAPDFTLLLKDWMNYETFQLSEYDKSPTTIFVLQLF